MRHGLCTAVAGACALAWLGCVPPANKDDSGEGGLAPGAPESTCPRPEGASAQATKAVTELNRVRQAAGLGCVAHVDQIAEAAQSHCAYYIANKGGMCAAKPHREVSSCGRFTGETFAERMKAANYAGKPTHEVMTYHGEPARAVEAWFDSVWHRLPMVSPKVDQAGYGFGTDCDTMDFGAGGTMLPALSVMFPYDQQVGVPISFDGVESPEPPRPPRGWPSGYPITLVAAGVTMKEHAIYVDGSGAPIDHHFMAPGDSRAGGLLTDEFMLYTFEPMKRKTRYRVRLVGEKAGAPVTFEWTFTTR